MSLVKQFSRIAHHTLVGLTGSTFSVPPSEDFTDGTWTIYDLALSEFGVNEEDKKLYIRIKDEIKEIGFALTASTAETLEQTLALGNDMGTYSINMNQGFLISSSNVSNFTLTDAQTRNVTPKTNLNIPGYTFGFDEVKTMTETITTGTGSTTSFTIYYGDFPDDAVVRVNVSAQGIQTNNALYYSNEMFAFFHVVGAVVTQIGVTDENERTNMPLGHVELSTDGTNINVITYGDGDGSSSFYWANTITYRVVTAL